jgi:hypothetical protein
MPKINLTPAVKFVQRNAISLSVVALSAAALIPMTKLAATGIEYAIAANDFIGEKGLTEEFSTHLKKY